MRENRLRALLKADQPSLSTALHSTWPGMVEAVGYTGLFDYVEFMEEYAPFDLYALENFCRAAELFDMGSMIKVDLEPSRFLAQRSIGAGFQSVLFADCHTVEDARACIRAVRPDTPEDGGDFGVGIRRHSYMLEGRTLEYVQALRDIVVVLMIEKKPAVDHLEEILSLDGIDMIQWGGSDYSMSIGRPGERLSPDIKAVEKRVIKTSLEMGVPPRIRISSVDKAKYYLDLGARHFCLGTDILLLHKWLKENGETLRRTISDT